MKQSASGLLIMSMSFFGLGCGQSHKVDVTVSVIDEQVVFSVPFGGINGILSFRVEDDLGNPLWDVALGSEKRHRIVYGNVPKAENMRARQRIPVDGQSPRGIRGKTVKVIVEYQYDRPFSASADNFEKMIDVPE